MSRTERETCPIGPSCTFASIVVLPRAIALSRRTPSHCRRSRRLRNPSFNSAFATWYFTASALMPISAAIFGLLSPCRTSSTVRHSAGVSTSFAGGRPRFVMALL